MEGKILTIKNERLKPTAYPLTSLVALKHYLIFFSILSNNYKNEEIVSSWKSHQFLGVKRVFRLFVGT